MAFPARKTPPILRPHGLSCMQNASAHCGRRFFCPLRPAALPRTGAPCFPAGGQEVGKACKPRGKFAAQGLRRHKRPQEASAADAGSKTCPLFFIGLGSFAAGGFISALTLPAGALALVCQPACLQAFQAFQPTPSREGEPHRCLLPWPALYFNSRPGGGAALRKRPP